MGQIITTQNLVVIKEVRHAGQQRTLAYPWIVSPSFLTC